MQNDAGPLSDNFFILLVWCRGVKRQSFYQRASATYEQNSSVWAFCHNYSTLKKISKEEDKAKTTFTPLCCWVSTVLHWSSYFLFHTHLCLLPTFVHRSFKDCMILYAGTFPVHAHAHLEVTFCFEKTMIYSKIQAGKKTSQSEGKQVCSQRILFISSVKFQFYKPPTESLPPCHTFAFCLWIYQHTTHRN